MSRRLVVVSSFLPPVVGGVEFFVEWMKRELPDYGWEVLTAGCRGDGDLVWPSLSRDIANVPLALPNRRAWSQLSSMIGNADVVLAQNFFYPISHWSTAIAQKQGVPIRTVVHGNSLYPAGAGIATRVGSRFHARSLGRWQLENAPPVAISVSSRAFLKEEFGLAAPVLPLPLPDLSGLGSALAPSTGGTLRIVFAGRLVPLKGPLQAVAAVKRLASHRRVRLDVFGDGPLRQALEMDVPEWLVLHGQRPRHEVLKAVREAHCFVSSSLTDNAQTSLLEAIALGVPSVATRVGDAPAYLRDPLDSLLVEADDVEALSTALDEVASSWDSWRALFAARAAELRQQHGTLSVARQLDGLLRSLSN